MHGWIETISSHSIKKITKSYLKRNDSNFIVCDWSKLVRTDYDQAVWNMKKVNKSMLKIDLNFMRTFHSWQVQWQKASWKHSIMDLT